MRKLTFTLLLAVLVLNLSAINLTYDKVRRNLRGIRAYENKDFDSATNHFEDNVVNNPGEGGLHFNLGNTLYRQGNFDAAINEYARALRDKEFQDRSAVYHNIGNALFEKQEYKDALDSYRNALISNPNNYDARYNYELTRLLLQETQDDTQKKPQSGDGDDEQEDQQEQQQQQQASADQDDSDPDGEATSVQQQEGDDDKSQDPDSDQQRKLEEAEGILQSLMAREREHLEEERERARERSPLRGKFW